MPKFPKLKGKAVLSPMAGVTDVAFRALCREYGAALTYTEFVNGTSLVRGSQKAQEMVRTDPIEKPVAVQLFGNSVADVIEAAKQMEDKFDIIDINCGCPAWKVIKVGAGSEMLKNPAGITSFVNKLTEAINKPVTIKIRTGIDDTHINAVEIAKCAEDAGAAAVAIHGRTQKQGYRGVANWDIIKDVKDAVNIPVIGNGDVTTPEIFKERLEQSGVDAIMIARGAIGNPYLFTQINEFMKKGTYEANDRIKHFSRYLYYAEKYDMHFELIRQHAMGFTKEVAGGARKREAISKSNSIEALKEILGL
jgi:tRNA-dihydrouridine synthase B